MTGLLRAVPAQLLDVPYQDGTVADMAILHDWRLIVVMLVAGVLGAVVACGLIWLVAERPSKKADAGRQAPRRSGRPS